MITPGDVTRNKPERCENCSSLSIPLREKPEGVHFETKIKDTFEELEESAANGCDLCRLFRHDLLCGATDISELCTHNKPVYFDSDFHSRSAGYYLRCGETEVELYDYESTPEKFCCEEKSQVVSSHAGADSTINLATQWIEECKEYHPDCYDDFNNKNAIPNLPTRVLDVGTSREDKIKLHISNGQRANYITLSHCWGRKDHDCKLSHLNLESWCEEISPDIIPKTFFDAIEVTRRLGQRYLWIDSCCIIQPQGEDRLDWLIEGAKMADIYRNTYCNILASAATDSLSGFLGPRLNIQYPLRNCTIRTNSVDTPYVYVAPKSPRMRGKLYTRGWVYQEECLPPRSLHWAPDALRWRCSSKAASEYSPGLLSEVQYADRGSTSLTVKGIVRNNVLVRNMLKSDSDEDVRRKIVGQWTSLIKEYTARELSVDTDRLAAITGLASSIATHAQFAQIKYFAGLWDHMLLNLLCWSSNTEGTNFPRRPNKYVAPSWSWASVIGRIEWTRMSSINFQINILSVETLPVSDPYGQVMAHSGKLVVKGKLKDGFRARAALPLCECCKDQGARDSVEFGQHFCEIIPPQQLEGDISEIVWDVLPNDPEEPFYCLLCGVNERTGVAQYGLALTRVSDTQDTYERVGWVSLSASFKGYFDDCEEHTIVIV